MPLLHFKVELREDNIVQRKVLLNKANTFREFYQVILDSMNFDSKYPGLFYVSNKQGKKLRAISTEVEKNLANAEYLSANRTPVSALVQSPDQRFIFEYQTPKKIWEWDIEMTGISPIEDTNKNYPLVEDSQGLAPDQYRPDVMKSNDLTDIQDEIYPEGENLSELDGFETEG